jgi:hypothetical protein
MGHDGNDGGQGEEKKDGEKPFRVPERPENEKDKTHRRGKRYPQGEISQVERDGWCVHRYIGNIGHEIGTEIEKTGQSKYRHDEPIGNDLPAPLKAGFPRFMEKDPQRQGKGRKDRENVRWKL